MNRRNYLLKIKLLEIKPEICRRFVVPADITLDRLHDVIQIVMGWTDSHLHEFTIGEKRYTEFPEYQDDGLECGQYRLVDLIKRKGRTFNYCYDFGDWWQHEVTIEDSRYFDHHQRYEIMCLDGSRACPPEDVGGEMGYDEFCKAIKDPNHEEHEAYMTWSGGKFDSEKFDIDEVNWDLAKYERWSRDRFQEWGREL